jgi:hypothetical protein
MLVLPELIFSRLSFITRTGGRHEGAVPQAVTVTKLTTPVR